jgi:hypothetical protein
MRDTPCDVWGVFLGYDGIIKQFNIFTILLSISLSRDRYDRAACDLPAWYFDGLLGNIDVREDLFCVVLWWN